MRKKCAFKYIYWTVITFLEYYCVTTTYSKYSPKYPACGNIFINFSF